MSKVRTYVPVISGEVEAIQYVKGRHDDVVVWCGGTTGPPADDPDVIVPHVYGNSIARIGDWVVRSQRNGRFFVLSEEQFNKAYKIKHPFEFDSSKIYISGGNPLNA